MYTKEDAYKVMFIFLNNIYEKDNCDAVGSLLGDMSLLNENMTVDPAILEDWNHLIEMNNFENSIDLKQMRLIIKTFLNFYKENFGFDLEKTIVEFEKISDSFNQYVNNILKNPDYEEKLKFWLMD